MADFQAKICQKFNISSLKNNQSKSITANIDGKDVFVGTYGKARSGWLLLPLAALHINYYSVTSKIRLTMPMVKMSRVDRKPWLAKMSFQYAFSKKMKNILQSNLY